MYHQQKYTFIMFKQLNELVLKSLKLKRAGPKPEKQIDRAGVRSGSNLLNA